MPVNGDAMSSAGGEKLTSLSLASAGTGGDAPDFGEAFQPHVDTKQIQVLPESTSPGKDDLMFICGGAHGEVKFMGDCGRIQLHSSRE